MRKIAKKKTMRKQMTKEKLLEIIVQFLEQTKKEATDLANKTLTEEFKQKTFEQKLETIREMAYLNGKMEGANIVASLIRGC